MNARRFDTRFLEGAIELLVLSILGQRPDGCELLEQIKVGEQTMRLAFDARQRVISVGLVDASGYVERVESVFCGDHEHAGQPILDVIFDEARQARQDAAGATNIVTGSRRLTTT
jgi:hypothetical protein